MPLGSSSDAPVIKPGPSTWNSFRRAGRLRSSSAISPLLIGVRGRAPRSAQDVAGSAPSSTGPSTVSDRFSHETPVPDPGRRSQSMEGKIPDPRLAPTTVAVIAAATEQKEQHKDDQ